MGKVRSVSNLKKTLLFSLTPLLIIFIALEFVQRFRYFGFTQKVLYLNLHFAFSGKPKRSLEPVIYRLPWKKIRKAVDSEFPYVIGRPGRYVHQTTDGRGNPVAVPYTMNSHGLRSKEFSAKKPSGVYRIIAIGGSSVAGIESPDDQTWPAILENKLKTIYSSRKYEVINAGFGSTFSKQHLGLFRNELLQYEPDMIIYYEAWNEAGFGQAPDPTPPPSAWMRPLNRTSAFLSQHSMLYLTAFEKAKKWGSGKPLDAFPYKKVGRKRHKDRLRHMIQISRKRGIQVVFVLQPLSPTHGLKEFLSGMNADQLEELTLNSLLPDFYRRIILQKVFLAQLVELSTEFNLPLLNPLRLFEEKRDQGAFLFVDHVHLTPEGNRVLGNFIAASAIFEPR